MPRIVPGLHGLTLYERGEEKKVVFVSPAYGGICSVDVPTLLDSSLPPYEKTYEVVIPHIRGLTTWVAEVQADTYNDRTATTYECGGELTDIPEDFRIDPSLAVEIPAGAMYLFIGVADCWYSDNTEDPDGFAVYLTALQKTGP